MKKLFKALTFPAMVLFVLAAPLSATGGEAYNFYYGQLHSHTSLSDGTGTPEEAFTHARDKGHADFLAVTDHSNLFDNESEWEKSTRWAKLKQAADKFTEDDRFIAIAGFEMTWADGTGHMNTYNTEWFESRNNNKMDLTSYYQRISDSPGSISQWNHPGDYWGDFNDFKHYSPEADKVINLVEIAVGTGQVGGKNYYRVFDYYTKALDAGWHVAPSINQDNHKADWITANDARTVILAPHLTREDIFQAIRDKRV